MADETNTIKISLKSIALTNGYVSQQRLNCVDKTEERLMLFLYAMLIRHAIESECALEIKKLMTFLNKSLSHFQFSLKMFVLIFRAMTSPSMKSTEKKTPEKKPLGSAEGDNNPQETAAEQEAPGMKLCLNNFAWFRVFNFARSLCTSY